VFICDLIRSIKKNNIGSTINFRKIFYDYYSFKYLIYGTSYIKRAILKYGYSNFKLEILKYCEASETLKLEKEFIELFKPEYNIV